MRRWLWVLLFLLGSALLAGALFVFFALSSLRGSFGRAFSDGAIRHTTLADEIGAAEVEAVALRDIGAAGGRWYLLRDVTTARGVRFSMWRDTFLVSLFRGGRCKEAANERAVEPLKKGVVFEPLYGCATPDTEISALVALAEPASEMQANNLPMAEWQALEAKVQADPRLFQAQYGQERARFAYRCSYEFPYVWEADAATQTHLMTRYDDWLATYLLPVLLPVEHDLQLENGYASSYAMHPAEGRETSAEGWAVGTSFVFLTREGERRKAPGVSVFKPKVTLRGSRAACDAFALMDFETAWQGDRDTEILQMAWDNGVVVEPGAGHKLDWTQVMRRKPILWPGRENLFDYRYFSLD